MPGFYRHPLRMITAIILTVWLCTAVGGGPLVCAYPGGERAEAAVATEAADVMGADAAQVMAESISIAGDMPPAKDMNIDAAEMTAEATANPGRFMSMDIAAADAVAGEYIIKYRSGVGGMAKSQLLNRHGLQRRHSFNTIDAQLVKMPLRMQALGVSSLLEELAADPAVEFIEPNYRLYPMETPISGDAGAAYLWGLKNYGQVIQGIAGTLGIDINLQNAWHFSQGSPEVLVAVIDTGIDISHPELAEAIWTNPGEIAGNGNDDDGNGFTDDVQGWDFLNGDNSVFDSAVIDKHGTHCAGVIAAARNADGVVGVAPGIKILPLKFMDSNGGDTAKAIAAIEYARAAGAKIVNCSWGGPYGSLALRETIANSGMLFVAAAGNAASGSPQVNIDISPLYPASFDLNNIIVVAAVNNRGALASFSYYGPNSVDVAAPGENIFSTLPGNNYGFMSGTSMAAPHVSGIAALAMSAGYTDIAAVRQRILDSALLHPLSSLSGRVLTGGLVDAAAAAEFEMTPQALDLCISGEMYAGKTLQANYTYFDANGDLEEGTQLQWYRGSLPDKSDGVMIDGAFNSQYRLTSDDVGKYIYFSVTPGAAAGLSPGETVYSAGVEPVETAHLADLQILHEGENLLAGYSYQQNDYPLTVGTTQDKLQILFTEVGGCTVTASYNDVPLMTGDLITLDGQGGILKVRVVAPETAERTYTITISQADNCFIATAAFGSKYAPAVKMLRAFRDDYLLTNSPGRALVAFYYRYSPPLANFIADREGLRVVTRVLLSPLIAGVYLLYHRGLLLAFLLLLAAVAGSRGSRGDGSRG